MKSAGSAAMFQAIALLLPFPAIAMRLGEHAVTPRHASAIPQALQDFWLHFHETEMCQEIDAVFAFSEHGMEIWCVVDSSGALERLRDRIEPLRKGFRIDLYVTRPQKDQQRPDDRQPPPSLWNNEQLRSHLGGAADWTPLGIPEVEEPRVPRDRDFLLKSRLQMFAEQTLELSGRARRYGMDLSELYRVFSDAIAEKETAARARRIFLAHATFLGRSLARIDDNLRRALPRPSKSGRSKSSKPGEGAPPLEEFVEAIARETEEIYRRVYRFIYPSDHTVELGDLKEPDLLQSLAELRHKVARLPKAR